jgi:ubiquinone biosynthesis protein UbiJ
MPFPSSLFASVVNHLLEREPWARDKLRPFAGRVAVIDAGVALLSARVAPDGMLSAAEGDADVTIRIRAADLPMILSDLPRATAYAQVEGNAEFANVISQLAQSLRWEAQADLSRFVGDIAAARMVAGAKAAVQTARATQQSLAENLAEYLLDENPVLVRPQSVADFSAQVIRLRDDVERLEKRVRKLQG